MVISSGKPKEVEMILNKNVNTLPGLNRFEDVSYDQDQFQERAMPSSRNKAKRRNKTKNCLMK
jgi:hypothetical protein